MKGLITCLALTVSCLSLADAIYNGEVAPFTASSGWDQNGSTLAQSTVAPHSPKNHLRAKLVLKNWWGAAAYMTKAGTTLDGSKYSHLKMWMKSSAVTAVQVYLFDANGKQSDGYTVPVTTRYQQFSIPIMSLTGVDLTKLTALVFAVSKEGAATYTVDIDDIEAFSECPLPTDPVPPPQPPPPPPPVPTPTPTDPVPPPAAGDQWIMGYYVGYQRSLYPPEKIDFKNITHLMVGRVVPNSNGTLTTNLDIDNVQGPALAKQLATLTRNAGRKSILMLGGDGAHSGWVGAASASNRPAFVAALLKLVSDWGYDGLDLDWEPITETDRPLLITLAKELKAAKPSLILTVPVGWVNANFAAEAWVKDLVPHVDRINVMSYLMAGDWDGWLSWHSSALKGHAARHPSSLEVSMNGYKAVGVPAQKLGLGIGFFGVCWKGVTAPRAEVAGASVVASDNEMSYTNIVGSYFQQNGYKWDDAAAVPYLSYASGYGPRGCNFISFDDERSAKLKGEFVRANGLGGIIIWTVGQGYMPASGTNPLLQALGAGVRGE